MQFSEHWLRSFVNPPLSSEALADAMTMAGLEVEARRPVAPPFHGVVVGKVLEVSRHPNADRLSVCKVDVGEGRLLTVVCGAPNAAPGINVPCALVGARLPAATIGTTVMRGVESQGMLCSAEELALADYAMGLLVLDEHAPPGADLRAVLDLDDTIVTLKLTPNRADCLSLVGIAREVGAITGILYAVPQFDVVPAASVASRAVRIDDAQACPRFCARAIRGIDARAPSPGWMQRRLERSGIRSVSAVVDVTNYVMLELGQPLHAYDDERLEGDIVVRFARSGDTLTLLNGQSVEPGPDVLLVADARKPLGLAGIMGGAASSIGTDTREVFLEGAFWNPAVIQGKARRLGFSTDAAYRFERGVDFANCAQAVERATALIVEICGGSAEALIDVQGVLPARDPVQVRAARVDRLLGIALAPETIDECFARLRFVFVRDHDQYRVTPPSYRFDLSIEEDFVEEVARIYGYDRITAAPSPRPQSIVPVAEQTRTLRQAKSLLVARGYQEILTFSFVDSRVQALLELESVAVSVLNPIAVQHDVMRSTLLGGLLETLRTNLSYKVEGIRIFEAGRCFVLAAEGLEQPMRLGGLVHGPALPEHWSGERRPVDFYDLKGDVEALLTPIAPEFRTRAHPALHPGRAAEIRVAGAPVGWMGELHPRLVRALELQQAPVVFELDWAPIEGLPLPLAVHVPKQPTVRRDVALVVAEALPAQTLIDDLARVAPTYVRQLSVFDVYRGSGVPDGMKSLAILVLMQDTERTLTDAQIDAAMSVLVAEAQSRYGAALRA